MRRTPSPSMRSRPCRCGRHRVDAELRSVRAELAKVREREAQLVAERDAARAAADSKGEFLARMSHDLRSPMMAVSGMAELLLETPLSGEQREMVGTVQRSAKGLVSIVNEILDYSKLQAHKVELEMRSLNVRDLVEECFDVMAPIATKKGVELAYVMTGAVPNEVIGDQTRLRQILMNLLSNALKFTDGGSVLVEVARCSRGHMVSGLEFKVTDTGVGIAPDRIDHLFDAYTQADASTTRRYGGTGLGLSICSGLVELMGGNLGAESTPGKGSTFRFTIACEASDGGDRDENPTIRGRRLLVVEQNGAVRSMVVQQLAGFGADVEVVASAADAMNRMGGEEAFDAVVLDRHLDDGDGLRLAGNIRAAHPRLPLVLLTTLVGSTGPIMPRIGAGPGFAAYVAKPIKRRRLAEALTAAVGATALDVTPAPPAEPAREKTDSQPGIPVLVVDDDEDIRRFTVRMLNRLGYAPATAASGAEAIAAVQGREFALVMMDMNMPGMDGPTAARKMGEVLPADRRPYIVASTGNGGAADRQRCLEAGMDDLLIKPWSRVDLEAVLERASMDRGGQYACTTAA